MRALLGRCGHGNCLLEADLQFFRVALTYWVLLESDSPGAGDGRNPGVRGEDAGYTNGRQDADRTLPVQI